MKTILFACQTALVLLLSAGCACGANAQTAPSASLPAQKSFRAKLPANVDIYATTDIGDGQQCLVGTQSDEDGLNERPVVYLSRASGGLAWHVQLPILKDAYQGRATHCLALANALYVLVQIDTNSAQSLNQTLLQIVELSNKTGVVMKSKYIDVPNVSAAYTEWVEEGDGQFKFEGSKLMIKGNYQLMSDRDDSSGKDPSVFTLELAGDLR